jgi:hypothetical protein
MNKLNEMWTALAAYQPQADAEGHGKTWAAMCKEKTFGNAWSAYAAYASAAKAAADAYAEADRWAQKVIDGINKLNEAQPKQEQGEPVACERCKQLEKQVYDLLGQLKVANIKFVYTPAHE